MKRDFIKRYKKRNGRKEKEGAERRKGRVRVSVHFQRNICQRNCQCGGQVCVCVCEVGGAGM